MLLPLELLESISPVTFKLLNNIKLHSQLQVIIKTQWTYFLLHVPGLYSVAFLYESCKEFNTTFPLWELKHRKTEKGQSSCCLRPRMLVKTLTLLIMSSKTVTKNSNTCQSHKMYGKKTMVTTDSQHVRSFKSDY